MRIGLQKWGVEEAQTETKLFKDLWELADRPPTQANKLAITAILDNLKDLYKRFTIQSGAKKEYEVTVSCTIFADMKREETLRVEAKDESEAKAKALQVILDELDVRFAVKEFAK